jgi:hypothetical protein
MNRHVVIQVFSFGKRVFRSLQLRFFVGLEGRGNKGPGREWAAAELVGGPGHCSPSPDGWPGEWDGSGVMEGGWERGGVRALLLLGRGWAGWGDLAAEVIDAGLELAGEV